MMHTPAELFDGAYAYLSVYLIGYVAIYIYMQFTSVFRSFGDPTFQMKGMLFTTVLNGVLDPMMIRAFGIAGSFITLSSVSRWRCFWCMAVWG